MSNEPQRTPLGAGNVDDLQFDQVESAAPPPAGVGEPIAPDGTTPPTPSPRVTACAACGEAITDVYFEGNGKVVCPRCRDAVMASEIGGSAIVRLLKATVYGIFAGVVGAAIWYGVRAGTGYEVGLIAIVVGILVGGAIKAGSKGRGGVGYQLLAVVLTYLSIALNYFPDRFRFNQADPEFGSNTVVVIIASAIEAIILPFYGGIGNIIGLLIIGFALFQAWVINKPNRITFNGPYRLAPAAGAPAPAGFAYGGPTPPPPMSTR